MRHKHLQNILWNKKFLVTVLAAVVPITSVQASGFRVPEVSVAGTASSNALVANTEELGAVAYNPAAISFHTGKAAMAGVNYINYETAVTPTGGTRTDGNGETDFYVPNLMLSTVGDNNWAFALLINAPFGLETSWPDNTFPGFAGVDALEPAMSKIKMLNFNPNLSYKIDSSSSFSFGLDFYDVRDLRLNTQAVKISGTGTGLGWNIGYIKKLAGNLTLGASYRSSVDTDITGTFDSTALGPPNGPFYLGAEAELEFPDIFQLGLHYQATPNFGIEFDVDRTGWSSFDEINVTNSTGGTFNSSTNNWKDSWAYRLGFSYNFNPHTKIMFGYSYDETPQPDSHFSARVPDADRQLFSVGASHTLAGSWILQYAYMHVVVDDRTVNSSTTYIPGTTPDANGTTAYNGKYESDVNLLGISLTKTF